jgi:hypothetical protein|tara:strand:- start:277 stop:699 length:423 start_codon:yes stop_codon:yes gene_type:complete
MLSKISLRLKLTDFINTDIEQTVMDMINEAHNKLSCAILLFLWFEEGDFTGKDLKEFLIRWEDKLSFKTVVTQGHTVKYGDFIYFDITPVTAKEYSHKRFTYYYIDSNKILNGLKHFYDITKFTTSNKSPRKQKRNDYED